MCPGGLVTMEFAEHALVLAEGIPAEGFVDNIRRMAFDNWEEREALYGDASQKYIAA